MRVLLYYFTLVFYDQITLTFRQKK